MRTRHLLRGGALILAVLIISSLVLVPGTSLAEETHADRVVVELDENGSAEMAVVLVYDLTDEQDADGFASIADDDEAQEEMRERFEERMTLVAEEMDDAVERDVSVFDAEIEVAEYEEDDRGVVELRSSWSNFADIDGEQMAVTEPFASGFDVDAELHVVFPDEYEVTRTNPSPTVTEDRRVVWSVDADLEEFTLLFETHAANDDTETVVADDQVQATDDDPADDGADDALTGFGVLAGLIALSVSIVRYRSSE